MVVIKSCRYYPLKIYNEDQQCWITNYSTADFPQCNIWQMNHSL